MFHSVDDNDNDNEPRFFCVVDSIYPNQTCSCHLYRSTVCVYRFDVVVVVAAVSCVLPVARSHISSIRLKFI